MNKQLTPEQASTQLSILTNREMVARKISFSTAWREVCNRETTLLEMSRKRSDREAERAAEQVKADARRTAAAKLAIIANSAPGRNWDEKWNIACQANPELMREATGK
jgi:hypothetical protein